MNPHVRSHLRRLGDGSSKNIILTEPFEYIPFVKLMSESYLILTDSGGIQEEAPILGVPVLVLRSCTERVEAIEAGAAKITGADSELIISEVSKLMDDKEYYSMMSKRRDIYGDGKAADRIIEALKSAEIYQREDRTEKLEEVPI